MVQYRLNAVHPLATASTNHLNPASRLGCKETFSRQACPNHNDVMSNQIFYQMYIIDNEKGAAIQKKWSLTKFQQSRPRLRAKLSTRLTGWEVGVVYSSRCTSRRRRVNDSTRVVPRPSTGAEPLTYARREQATRQPGNQPVDAIMAQTFGATRVVTH